MSIVLRKHIREELGRGLGEIEASRSVIKKLIDSFDSIINETVDYINENIEDGFFNNLNKIENEAENEAYLLLYREELKLKIEECEEKIADLKPHVDPNDPAQYDDPKLEEISNLDSEKRYLKLKLQNSY